nr:hypothetical protein Iba_chr05fCG10410 [Ipomoea batatas]
MFSNTAELKSKILDFGTKRFSHGKNEKYLIDRAAGLIIVMLDDFQAVEKSILGKQRSNFGLIGEGKEGRSPVVWRSMSSWPPTSAKYPKDSVQETLIFPPLKAPISTTTPSFAVACPLTEWPWPLAATAKGDGKLYEKRTRLMTSSMEEG